MLNLRHLRPERAGMSTLREDIHHQATAGLPVWSRRSRCYRRILSPSCEYSMLNCSKLYREHGCTHLGQCGYNNYIVLHLVGVKFACRTLSGRVHLELEISGLTIIPMAYFRLLRKIYISRSWANYGKKLCFHSRGVYMVLFLICHVQRHSLLCFCKVPIMLKILKLKFFLKKFSIQIRLK